MIFDFRFCRGGISVCLGRQGIAHGIILILEVDEKRSGDNSAAVVEDFLGGTIFLKF